MHSPQTGNIFMIALVLSRNAVYGMDCDWSNVRVRLRRKYRWAQARSYYISAMNPIEIRGPENSVSHRSKIMEREKHEEDTIVRGGGRSYTRAKHGKAISVQPRFLVSAKEVFAEEVREFTCALTHVHRPWKRMNSHEWSSDSRFALSPAFSFSPPLSYNELCSE